MKPETLTRLGSVCKYGHEHENTGHSLRYVSSGACVVCIHAINTSLTAHKRDYMRARRRDGIERTFIAARDRASKKRLPFDLDVAYLRQLWDDQEGRCYWVGVPLDLDGERFKPLKANLDRLDASFGYVRGNVVWSSQFANNGRGTASVEEFEKFLVSVGLRSPARLISIVE